MNALTILIMVCVAWVGFAVGVAYARWQTARQARMGRRGARPMQLVARDYTSPILPAIPATQAQQWELYLMSFAFHGGLTGFSYRRMREAGLCRRAAWETYTGLLAGEGVIRTAARSETGWAGGWSYSRFRAALKHGRIRPPFPVGDPPSLNSAHAATQTAQHSTGNTGGTDGR